MNLTRIAPRAWPALIALLALWPALMVVLSRRHVDALELAGEYPPDSIYSWMGRLGALTILALAAATIAFGPQKTKTPRTGLDRTGLDRTWPILVALTVYLIGTSIMPALFGAVPHFQTGALHAFVVLYAAYAVRRLPSKRFLAALKGSLLFLMLAGLATIVLAPGLSVQTDVTDLRLPFLEFRFWGIGSSPNNIAPLALLLLMLTIHTPFRMMGWTVLAWLSATLTIILSQSLTTWSAGLLVVPAFAFYCLTPKPIRKARISPLLAIVALVGIAIGSSMLIWEVAHFDFSNLGDASVRIESGSIISHEKYDESGMFSGRTDIWEVAISVWKDHPWFGYGTTAWDPDFRNMVGIATAFHAHNQVMQSVSVGGWVSLGALLVYLLTLLRGSLKTLRRSNGLTLALMVILLIRGFTESPLETTTLLSGDLLFHVTLLYLVVHYLSVRRSRKHGRQHRIRRSRRAVAPSGGLQPAFQFRQSTNAPGSPIDES